MKTGFDSHQGSLYDQSSPSRLLQNHKYRLNERSIDNYDDMVTTGSVELLKHEDIQLAQDSAADMPQILPALNQ